MPQQVNDRPMTTPLSHRGPSKAPTADSIEINRKKMFGLLHEPQTGKPLVRHVKYLKVGFGLGADTPDVHVRMRHPTEKDPNPWVLEMGAFEEDETGKNRRVLKTGTFATKAEIMEAYRKALNVAPIRKHPVKFPYFTFQKLGVDGNYRPDFDHIELYGANPTELDVVFLINDPLEYAWQAWSYAKLLCEGDGINARRRVDWAHGDHEKKAAERAQRNGQLYFPILGGCATGGCPFPGKECKPHGSLYFQLAKSPRFGVTCSYDTTGKKSLRQLFSGIENIKAFTSGVNDPDRGFIAGAPLALVLTSYKVTTPSGAISTQYSVRLEFRATANAVDMVRLLNESVYKFQEAATVNVRRIAAPVALAEPPVFQAEEADEAEEAPAVSEGDPGPALDEATLARHLHNEYYHDGEDEPEPESPDDFDEEDGIPQPEAAVNAERPPAPTTTPAPPVTDAPAPARVLKKTDFTPPEWQKALLYWKAAGKGNEAKLLAFLGAHPGVSVDEVLEHLKEQAEAE